MFTVDLISKCLEFLAALIVYISILEQQAKYGDALEILSGTLGSLLMIEVDKLRIQVLSEAFTFVLKIKTILFVSLFSYIYDYTICLFTCICFICYVVLFGP